MKLIVFGATGGIGQQVMEQALSAGHEVTAVVRKPSAVTMRHERLKVIQGDVLDPATFREQMVGKDAVVSAIGARDTGPTVVYSQGVANIMEAMRAANVRRIICISASGLEPGPLWQKLIAGPMLWLILKNMYRDLALMEKEVQASGLDWTIIRPPRLSDGPRTGHYNVAINKHLALCWIISRADVGDYIVNHVTDRASWPAMVEVAQ